MNQNQKVVNHDYHHENTDKNNESVNENEIDNDNNNDNNNDDNNNNNNNNSRVEVHVIRHQVQNIQGAAQTIYLTVTPYSSLVKYGLDSLSAFSKKVVSDEVSFTVADRVDERLSDVVSRVNQRFIQAKTRYDSYRKLGLSWTDVMTGFTRHIRYHLKPTINSTLNSTTKRIKPTVSHLLDSIQSTAKHAKQSVEELGYSLVVKLPNRESLTLSAERRQRLDEALTIAGSLSTETKIYIRSHSVSQLTSDLLGFFSHSLHLNNNNKSNNNNNDQYNETTKKIVDLVSAVKSVVFLKAAIQDKQTNKQASDEQ